jgi:signal transduction histidine kinase
LVEELYTPEQLNHMHQQLWQCVLEFANVSAAQERNRIARELHDSLGHALTALNFQLQTATKLCKPDPNQAQEFLNEANRLMAIATQEVRQSVKALRNDPLATQSLETLIASLVNDFHQTTGILPEVEINLLIPLLPHFTAPLYRIIQEALNNICKYAQATAVQIHLSTTSTGLHLTIQDNGRGFDPENISGGYGLRGMQERIAVLQGHFHLESQPKAGCCIHVEIPMQISNLLEIPKIPEISNISIISEISIPQESVSLSPKPSVSIGEWQTLNLNEWQSITLEEFI